MHMVRSMTNTEREAFQKEMKTEKGQEVLLKDCPKWVATSFFRLKENIVNGYGMTPDEASADLKKELARLEEEYSPEKMAESQAKAKESLGKSIDKLKKENTMIPVPENFSEEIVGTEAWIQSAKKRGRV